MKKIMDYFNLDDIEAKEQHITVKFKQNTKEIKANKKVSLPFYVLDFLIENEYCEIINFSDYIIADDLVNEIKADPLTNLSAVSFSSLESTNINKYFFRFISLLYETGKMDKNVISFYNILCKRIQLSASCLFNIDICISGKGFSSKVILHSKDVNFNDNKQINISSGGLGYLDADEKSLFDRCRLEFSKFRLL